MSQTCMMTEEIMGSVSNTFGHLALYQSGLHFVKVIKWFGEIFSKEINNKDVFPLTLR